MTRIEATRRELLGSCLALGSAIIFRSGQAAGKVAMPSDIPLERGFRDPPEAARPRVWWHWMNGNVSVEGARLDLAWMKRVGIGGVHAFSGGKLGSGPVVPQPAPFMSPGWQDAFRTSLDFANTARMEFGIAGSPGWHVTGGPWVAPGDGMKKYVWSETAVRGGRRYRGILAPPPRVTGPFMSVRGKESAAEAYGDSIVVAFPTPVMERSLPIGRWRSNMGPIDPATIANDAFADNGVTIMPSAGETHAWIEVEFAKPVMMGAVILSIKEGANAAIEVDDGAGELRRVREGWVNSTQQVAEHFPPQRTLAFAPVRCRRIRIVLRTAAAADVSPLASVRPSAKADGLTLTQLRLIGGARVENFEVKAGFGPMIPIDALDTPAISPDMAIKAADVIDLTDVMRSDGTLDWTPPPGDWTVLRLGWSLTGRVNGPAEPSATGLEVDKFDASAVRRYLTHYLDLYEQASGGKLGPDGIQTLLIDSWEAGVQNWTPAILAEFRTRRGYDPVSFVPVLSGRIVDSSDATERFLFDFRQTLKDLVVDNHYGVVASELKARGMGFYSEALGDNARAIADGMAIKARADIPTSEYWYRPFATLPGQPPLKADIEEAASTAHVYGKSFVACEALTVAALNDAWAFSPAMLKPVADEIFARGVNRFLLHESHHQPLVDKKPGLQLFIWGQYFNRNDTWAEYAAPWVTYLARTSHMLQQGQFVADVAYFYGEERNLTEQFLSRFNTDVPKGYAYDYINPEALLTLLSVRDGCIVTPSGMTYRVLFIPESVRRFTLPVLRKLRELVAAGGVLVGRKALGGLGLASRDDEIEHLADEIWGDGDIEGRQLGKGRVFSDLQAAFAAQHIAPDFVCEDHTEAAAILHSHRRTDKEDIYFVSNQSDRSQSLRARFRIIGKAPEFWRAETGAIEVLGCQPVQDGTAVPLTLAPHEAVFIVFRSPVTPGARTEPKAKDSVLALIEGPWTVTFEKGRGAPASATLEKLISWPDSSDPGIRYFSGVATYAKDIAVDRAWLRPKRRIALDLGTVRELAVVSVNGKRLPQAWHPPYVIDITEALKPGGNRLEIEVVNLWPNRLIGDKQPGATPVAFAPDSRYIASSKLLPSGLLGPVKLTALDHGQNVVD